jgi:hypothetical protein
MLVLILMFFLPSIGNRGKMQQMDQKHGGRMNGMEYRTDIP